MIAVACICVSDVLMKELLSLQYNITKKDYISNKSECVPVREATSMSSDSFIA